MRASLTTALLVTAAACGPAMAQGDLGAGVGQAHVNIDGSGTLTCDKSDTADKLDGGDMRSPNFGVEADDDNQFSSERHHADLVTLGLHDRF